MFSSLRISHVEFRFPGSEKLGPGRNGRMERKISGEKGQPREVDQNFRKDFPEIFCSIRFRTGIFGNFGRMERAHHLHEPHFKGNFFCNFVRAHEASEDD